MRWNCTGRSARCPFNVSNVATFSFIFGDSLYTDKGQETLSRHVSDMVLRYVLTPAHITTGAKDGR